VLFEVGPTRTVSGKRDEPDRVRQGSGQHKAAPYAPDVSTTFFAKEKMMGLERAYTRVKEIIRPDRTECLDVVKQVERLRSTWRPERVRVVLLAESHVWTSYKEAQSRVTQPNDMEANGIEPGFARFVYCLGYGEPQLVSPPITQNGGTPQYWGLFWNTVRDPQLKVVGERDW
jgi:hypothetical protein